MLSDHGMQSGAAPCGLAPNRMKIVYRAGDITEAEIVKGMLFVTNIEAHVCGYYLQGGIGELAPTDLAKVHVPDEDGERAREIICYRLSDEVPLAYYCASERQLIYLSHW